MHALGVWSLALCALVSLAGCGEDEKAPRLPANGSGGRGTGGADGGSSGGSRSGGAASKDGGQGGDVPDAPGPGNGGVPADGAIIVFPPIEGGIAPEDAGTPAPRDCSPTGTKQVSADPCLAFAEAECARFESCAAFTLVVGYGDVASCVTARRRECEATFSSPGQDSILEAVRECAARFINAPCNCVLGETCPALAPKPGTLANGAPCFDARQCASGVCTSSRFTCGECAESRNLGEPCGGEIPRCRAGLVCSSDRICERPRVRGQRCSTSDDCARDTVCVDGKCGDHLGAGADCRNDSLVCDPLNGVLCDSFQCVKVEYTEATGDTALCGPNDGKLTLCSANNRCTGGVGQPGHCEPRGGAGAECDPEQNAEGQPACLPGLTCDDTGRCVAGGALDCR